MRVYVCVGGVGWREGRIEWSITDNRVVGLGGGDFPTNIKSFLLLLSTISSYDV